MTQSQHINHQHITGDVPNYISTPSLPSTTPTTITALRKDIYAAAKNLSDQEVRFLVDTYYQLQDSRVAFGNMLFSLKKSGEPNLIFDFLHNEMETLEKVIIGAMERYTRHHKLGAWAKQVKGIGPVLSAGILAYFEYEKANSPSSYWRYAGLAPGQRRKRGEHLDFNPALKKLCWKIGESFVKVSGRDGAIYGHMYSDRKAYETLKNEEGIYTSQAEQILAEKKFNKATEAYKAYSQGKLPAGHIHARAKRFAVKAFLKDLYLETKRQKG